MVSTHRLLHSVSFSCMNTCEELRVMNALLIDRKRLLPYEYSMKMMIIYFQVTSCRHLQHPAPFRGMLVHSKQRQHVPALQCALQSYHKIFLLGIVCTTIVVCLPMSPILDYRDSLEGRCNFHGAWHIQPTHCCNHSWEVTNRAPRTTVFSQPPANE